MRLEQAIFTSARTAAMQGYHLALRSSGVDDRLAQTLAGWGPSHGALASADPDAQSLNFHPLDDDWLGLSRTVYGGHEYSGRGGLQVVTLFSLMHGEQLAGYDYHPVLLARMALALGRLRLPAALPDRIDALELPDGTIVTKQARDPHDAVSDGPLELVSRLLDQGERVAVIGRVDPLQTLESLLERLMPSQRLKVSFTTGLKPSARRPFSLHFLPALNNGTERQLAAQGVTCVEF